MLNQRAMIITCPACATRYEVPEGAIGAEGRTVRCANCRHSWTQYADDASPAEGELAPVGEDGAYHGASAPPAAAEQPPDELVPEASAAPAAGSSAYAAPAMATPETMAAEELRLAPGRRWVTWLVALALIVAVLAGIAFAALRWYGVPDWLPFARAPVAHAETGLVLDFPMARMDRRTLADGTEYFGTSGTVTNTGAARRKVPPIEIVLRDSHRQVVYRWEVVPPRRQLAPGESMTISQAVTDIPRAAIAPEIGWKAT